MINKELSAKAIVAGSMFAAGAVAAHAQATEGFYAGQALNFGQSSKVDLQFDTYSLIGNSIGAFGGYNFVRGDWSFGVEIAASAGMQRLDGYEEIEIGSFVDLKARAGRVFGQTLVYGVLGYSSGTVGWNSLYVQDLVKADGMNYGVGVEWSKNGQFFVGAEWLNRKLDVDPSFYASGLTDDGIDYGTVSIRTGWRF